jgi:hypothetical protein
LYDDWNTSPPVRMCAGEHRATKSPIYNACASAYRAEHLELYAFDRGWLAALEGLLERRAPPSAHGPP